jgi:hypothetical protein
MDKAHFLIHHIRTSIYKKLIHFQEPLSSISTIITSVFNPIEQENLIWIFKIKIKKKRAKVSSRFTKKQVQALRVFEKISTLSGSIFSKKLAFLKPST